MIDTNDATWAAVAAYATQQTEAAVAQLKTPGVSFDEVQYLRGRVAAFEAVLALPTIAVRPEAEQTVDY